MSNSSFKDQLKAAADQLSITPKQQKPKAKHAKPTKRSAPAHKKPTAKSAKKPPTKPSWLEYVQYGVALLKVHYPACFLPADKMKPLKKGIKQELVKALSNIPTVSTDDKICMIKSLSYYVNTMAYLKKVLVGVDRINLQGQADGAVTAEEAKYSLERLKAKQAARKTNKQSQPSKVTKEVAEPA